MVHGFYASYRVTIVLPMCHHLRFIIFARQLQLDHILVRGVGDDVIEETIRRVMFGIDFTTPASISE